MGSARLLGSSDTRILLAGVAAFVALVAYVAVAYADTHATSATTQSLAKKLAREIAPWTPVYGAKLAPVPLRGGGFAVRVAAPATRGAASAGTYGALARTLAYRPPPGRRFAVSLWLRSSRGGRIEVKIDELGLGGLSSLFVVQTTVPATTRWHRFTFRRRVEGRRLALSLYVARSSSAGSWFAVRDLAVAYH